MINDPDMVAMIGASAALTISGMPFMGPIAGTRVGYKDGEFMLNPTVDEMLESDLDLVVAGTQEGVLMVESEAEQLSEDIMLDAVMFGWRGFQPVIEAIIDLAEMAAKEPWDLKEEDPAIKKLGEALKAEFSAPLAEAYKEQIKLSRQEKVSALRDQAVEKFTDTDAGIGPEVVTSKFKSAEADVVRGQIIKTGGRIDGRKTVDVRPIVAEVGILPRAHGSALFTRGETQALVVATLGTGTDEQMIDALAGEYKESFMLHYNFPPYSVGECGRMGATGRREIGHGKLAWRALHPLLPTAEDFPYTIRAVSEITESNGSSSMATVCGTSLALMDAGVPLTAPVAGIAMGLIKEDEDFAVLSDILGDEDHLGDMDFKVAGTSDGITSLQMDIKITSITEEIMKIALGQAKDGRLYILDEMEKAISSARSGLSEFAPQIQTISIPTDKIRDVIGTGGKVIREIIETTGAKIDIEDDGTIKIAASDGAAIEKAINIIRGITDDPEVGAIYEGKVVKVVDFGAFVNFMNRDGLVHISELENRRVAKVTDVINEGDTVKVALLSVDDRGKYKLSMKRVDQETGKMIEEPKREENSPEEAAG
jgi:polyribonucleotide nucleotidyltransferase